MSSILVDTGPLVALADKRDHAHLDCTSFLENYRGRLVTTWAVLTEFSHLAPSITATLPLYRWIEKGGLELLPLGRDELVRAIDWIEKYADRPMDLADASLVLLAEHLGHGRILTTDERDFGAYRFKSRQPFDNLLADGRHG